MRKVLKAVEPYVHPGYLNFKTAPYEAWKRCGGSTVRSYYPCRLFHGIVYRWELPMICKRGKEARLRFVEPVSIRFDTFPDNAFHEIVPMFWDCWPCFFDDTCRWLRCHDVRTAVFSSRQTAERVREVLGKDINVIWCPEAVDSSVYDKGKLLKDRGVDLLEFGRSNEKVVDASAFAGKKVNGVVMRHVCTCQNGKFIYTNEQLYEAMGNAKVTIALPRSMTAPELAGDTETLTQRYWECMLSRMVMVGHAPGELVDFIGYNPVIELREDVSAVDMIVDVIEHIEDYQSLVDKNFRVATALGSWNVRMKWLMRELSQWYEL